MTHNTAAGPIPKSLPCTEEILSYEFQYEDDVSEAVECPPEIHFTIPEGFEIRRARYGIGIYTTKFIPKNDYMFTAYYIPIHDKQLKVKEITDRGDIIEIDTSTHFLNAGNGTYLLDPCAALINHSCDANANNIDEIIGMKVTRRSSYYAVRDIQPNEEITINYLLAVYEAPPNLHPIDPCECGSPKCFGSMRGFKNLPESAKQALLPYTLLHVRVAHFMDKQKKVDKKLDQN
ncbi:unnamed protein product [Rotaria socialis]|uniref:SET domain-containing protein n=1 Tax=Rotaria socialis TaxID=392032 RepID=A0A818N8N8_9BILA|nr:unnamed protein product [Rotaria socialis]CAF3277131.1 unnamed protein product [Rotaria socialis]CAF3410957.1 unnamed protein product [Rotaria socialis]CAF3464562.1 unnamed protein product [Rotaria socialis]CAF3602280.1 unnamed protein product [Rotaria socialis]